MFPFHADVLKAYVSTFDLSSTSHSFDASLRLFLGSFRLPGESQCIDRLMEAFSVHLFQGYLKVYCHICCKFPLTLYGSAWQGQALLHCGCSLHTVLLHHNAQYRPS